MTTMTQVKTADLIGPALDWAVAKAQGWTFGPPHMIYGAEVWRDSAGNITGTIPAKAFKPSTDWSQGGPLIDKYKVGTVPLNVGLAGLAADDWFATAFFNGESYDTCHKGEGPSALIAACRAIVGLLLGDVVSVPAELVQGGGV